MNPSSPRTPPPARTDKKRLYVWLGVGLPVLGLFLVWLMMQIGILVVPWYAPVLAGVGAVLLFLAWRRDRSTWRLILLVLVSALVGLECWMLQHYMLPAYAGRIAVEQPFPEFAAQRADGKSFTLAQMIGIDDTVLVFYRGHW